MLDEYSGLVVYGTVTAVVAGVLGVFHFSGASSRMDPVYAWSMLVGVVIIVARIWTVVFRSQCTNIVVRFLLSASEEKRPVINMLVINLSHRHDISINRISLMDVQGREHFLQLAPVYLGKDYAASHPDATRDTRARGPVKVVANGSALILEYLPETLSIPTDGATRVWIWLYTNRGFAVLSLPWSSHLRTCGYLLQYYGHPEEMPRLRQDRRHRR